MLIKAKMYYFSYCLLFAYTGYYIARYNKHNYGTSTILLALICSVLSVYLLSKEIFLLRLLFEKNVMIFWYQFPFLGVKVPFSERNIYQEDLLTLSLTESKAMPILKITYKWKGKISKMRLHEAFVGFMPFAKAIMEANNNLVDENSWEIYHKWDKKLNAKRFVVRHFSLYILWAFATIIWFFIIRYLIIHLMVILK